MTKKHLLIVDDHEDILYFLAQGIRQIWPTCIVLTAKNGYDALTLIQKATVDLMLVDYRMPGMNGLELAKIVRRISPKTSIVMMSSIDPIEIKQQKGSYDGYLDKPFSIAAIQPFMAAC